MAKMRGRMSALYTTLPGINGLTSQHMSNSFQRLDGTSSECFTSQALLGFPISQLKCEGAKNRRQLSNSFEPLVHREKCNALPPVQFFQKVSLESRFVLVVIGRRLRRSRIPIRSRLGFQDAQPSGCSSTQHHFHEHHQHFSQTCGI